MSGLEVIGALASVVSGVVGAMGAMQTAEANARAAEYNAAISERNAKIADQNRMATLQQADVEQEDHRRETRRMLASIRASYGASGIELAGSPLDVLEDTALERGLDTQRIQFEAKVRNREGAIQMLGLNEEASLQRMRADNERQAGSIAAMGAIVGGVGQGLSRIS